MNATQGLALRFAPKSSATRRRPREISCALQVAFEGFSVTQQAMVGRPSFRSTLTANGMRRGKVFNYDRKKLIVSFAGEKTLSYLPACTSFKPFMSSSFTFRSLYEEKFT
jgi:hypothetical protein